MSGRAAHQIDLTDRVAVREALEEISPDVVLHLAAIAFVAHEDIDSMYRVNVVGTRNLLAGLQSMPIRPRRVTLASSANVYGNCGGVDGETQQPHLERVYAFSKLAMEYMANLFSADLPLTVVRPFNYSGAGQSENFLIPKIITHFRRRAPIIELGNIDVHRDFNDVRNVVSVYERLARRGQGENEIYNVCTGEEYSLSVIIDIVREISGHDIEVRINPAFVRKNEVKQLVGDPSRLRAAIGELPAFSMRGMLQWMYETDRDDSMTTPLPTRK
jgi:nucleoside-diphosphate-sugar epimerase